MVHKTAHVDQAPDDVVEDPEVIYLSPEEGHEMFDAAARKIMGMSGEEFMRRWDAGEYDEIVDTAGHRHIWDLVALIPFARQDA